MGASGSSVAVAVGGIGVGRVKPGFVGGRVEVTHLDGVTHAFDESEHGPGSTSRYSKPAALEADGFFRDFLRRYLTAPPPAAAS